MSFAHLEMSLRVLDARSSIDHETARDAVTQVHWQVEVLHQQLNTLQETEVGRQIQSRLGSWTNETFGDQGAEKPSASSGT